ncbi:MAG TPA: ABC transporter permease [Candidatus Binatus sp.]|nr:ABC transporter permease [Candidatus Binatus sp.]
MIRPAPLRRSVAALASMELRLALRRGENLLVMLVIPIAVLAFFANLGIGPLGTGPSAVAALLPGTLAIAVIATSLVNLGIATAYERAYGVLKRLGGAPISRPGVVAAKVAAVLGIEVVQVALLLIVAAAVLGWQPSLDSIGLRVALLIVAAGLGTAAFAGLGLLMAGTLRTEATLALANGLFLAFLMLGGTILPLDHLPEPLASIGLALPSSALTDLLHAALGATAGGDVARPLAVLAAWAAGACALAARLFRWE